MSKLAAPVGLIDLRPHRARRIARGRVESAFRVDGRKEVAVTADLVARFVLLHADTLLKEMIVYQRGRKVLIRNTTLGEENNERFSQVEVAGNGRRI